MSVGEAVEVKVNLAGPVDDSLEALNVTDAKPRRIWFMEDLTPGLETALPLLNDGVILRIRNDGDKADSTLKLRPCRRSQLEDPWLGEHEDDGESYALEGDWTGPRRVLAAAMTCAIKPKRAEKAVAPGGDPRGAFSDNQIAFLVANGPVRVNVGTLRALGPIAATSWKRFELAGFDVKAERWQVGALDRLELSIRVETGDDPASSQLAFETAVRRLHLSIDTSDDSKTRQALTELLAARATQVAGIGQLG